MQVNSSKELLEIIEAARKNVKISEREMALRASKSHAAYSWWKNHAGVTSFDTAVKYAGIVGLRIMIEPK